VVAALAVTGLAGLTDRGRPFVGTTRPPPSTARAPAAPSKSTGVGAADPLAEVLHRTGPSGWTEAQIASAVLEHTATRGIPNPPSGMPVAQVTDAPSAGDDYRQSRRSVPDGIVVRVTESTRLEGWESRPLVATRDLTLVTGDLGGPTVLDDRAVGHGDLFDLGPLHAVTDGPALVLGDAPQSSLREMARAAAAAVPRVTRFWGTDWGRRVVVVAPASLLEFAEELGRDPATVSSFVAVTTGETSDPAPDGVFVGSRVYVNPQAWAELSPLGQRVVLTHETTHVAAQTVSRPSPPTWLNEGVADEVGFAGSGVAERVEAGAVLDEVKGREVPAMLPTTLDFSGTTPTIAAQAYAGADVAVLLILHRYGLARLRQLFRDATLNARSGADPDGALAEAFSVDLGLTVASFTAAWRAELRRLAAG
jgi:hypothetical protein